jgi:hypothetical protein
MELSLQELLFLGTYNGIEGNAKTDKSQGAPEPESINKNRPESDHYKPQIRVWP